MGQVIIGMDPHKRSATIEVMAADEGVAGGGRYGTDAAGLAAVLAGVRQWPDRIWAVEGSRGVGRQVAAWLAGAGEQVVDVAARGPVPPGAVRVPAAPVTGRHGPVRRGTAPRRPGAAHAIKPGVSNGHGQTAADERHAIDTIAEAPHKPGSMAHAEPEHAADAPRPWPSVQTPTVRTDRPNRVHRPS